MANKEQEEILNLGAELWNEWREENPDAEINLLGANLSGAYLRNANLLKADLSRANLEGVALNNADLRNSNLKDANLSHADLRDAVLVSANLEGADLSRSRLEKTNLMGVNLTNANLSDAFISEADIRYANFQNANLERADLSKADLEASFLIKARLVGAKINEANLSHTDLSFGDLSEGDLSGSNLTGANLMNANLRNTNLKGSELRKANLYQANLSKADLTEANLIGATLVLANLKQAILNNATLVQADIDDAEIYGSSIYGVSVWDIKGEFRQQRDLVITRDGEPVITVDNIKIAQFIYLILNNSEIRGVINALTSKSVLILGRFAIPERKAILDALRNKLREYDLLPIVFDFDRPTDKDFTETIKTLAGLSYFVIADVTNPKSSPLELQATVPDYQIPFVPIIQEGESPFAMMVDLQKKYDWVLDTLEYDSIDTLIAVLKSAIIDPAIEKHNELKLIKAREPKIRSAKDFLAK